MALACLALPATAGAVALKPGDLLVANYSDAVDGKMGVIKIDPRTGKATLVSSNQQPVNQGTSDLFNGPWDLTLMPNGELMVTNASGGSIVGVNPVTGKQRLVSDNLQPINSSSGYLSFATGIVRLPDGDLAVANGGAESVLRIDPGNGKQTVLSSNSQPVNVGTGYYSNVYDINHGIGGSLVVADVDAFGEGGLISVDPATGKETKLSANDQPINASSQFFSEPASVHLYRGSYYVADGSANGGDGGVVGVDPASGKQRIVSDNTAPANAGAPDPGSAYGIAVEPGGRIILTEELGFSDGNGGLFAVNRLTGVQSILASNVDPPNAGSSELIAYPDGVIVVPPKCGGRYPTMVGTSGKDKITGTPFPDIIAGLGGRDTLKGLGAADRLCGGPGPDLLLGGKGKDLLVGAKGRDRLRGGPGRDRLRGGPGRDRQRQ
jgi:Ca2+-binding RTX toxin-like protein